MAKVKQLTVSLENRPGTLAQLAQYSVLTSATVARPKKEKTSLDVVAVLDALRQQEARQPGSVAVRVGRHKRTVVLISRDLFAGPHSQKELKLT
jgi:hypothetical protein